MSKVAVVTGRDGASAAAQWPAVVIAEADTEAGAEAAATLADLGPVRFAPTDVSQEHAVTAMMDAALADFGRIDALINNAGISRNRPRAELSLQDRQIVIGVNLTGAFLCAARRTALARGRASLSTLPRRVRRCPNRIPRSTRPPTERWRV